MAGCSHPLLQYHKIPGILPYRTVFRIFVWRGNHFYKKQLGARTFSSLPPIWRSIRDLNSGGAVNALSHFEFCVPNAVCAPPGSKQAVSSRPFWPHHADFQRIRPQNRVGTSKSIVPPFGAKSNAFREKCKMPCKITGRDSGPPGQVLAGLSRRRISPQARKSPHNPRILSC